MSLDTETPDTVEHRKATFVRYDADKLVLRLGLWDAQRLLRVLGRSNPNNPGMFGKRGYDALTKLLTEKELEEAKAVKTGDLPNSWKLDPSGDDTKFKIERHDTDHFQFTMGLRDALRLAKLLGWASADSPGMFNSYFFEDDIRAAFEDEEWDALDDDVPNNLRSYEVTDDRL